MTRFSAAIGAVCLASTLLGGTFRRALERVPSMDPIQCATVYAARAVALCYETPLEYVYGERPYRLKPGLLSKMPEISPDGLHYTLTLRTNAVFHASPALGGKSRPVTAEDLRYSIARVKDPANASAGAWLAADIVKMEVKGRHQLTISLRTPNPQFGWYLAMPYFAVVPKEAVGSWEFRECSVGSGPYRLVEWKRNHHMRFERATGWPLWQETNPKPFDSILYLVIDDPTTQWMMFLNGELDFLTNLTQDSWDIVFDAQGNLSPELAGRNIHYRAEPALNLMYLGINMRDPLLGRNRALRQALCAAFDWNQWRDYFQGRVAGPIQSPVPPVLEGAVTNRAPFAFDLGLAKRLLKEAGYPGGIDPKSGLPLRIVLDVGKPTQEARETSELIASFYRACGLEVVPRYNTWPAFLKRLREGQTQLFRIGWVADYPDAQNFMQLFISRNLPPGPNRTAFVDPETDALYAQAEQCLRPEDQHRFWRPIQERVRTECPMIFTHCSQNSALVPDALKAYRPSDFPYGEEKYFPDFHRRD
ncbi:MAG: ABC transporter substrate-binding protein [Kiritimatiellia bacterium]